MAVLRSVPIVTGDHNKNKLQGKQKNDAFGNLLLDYLHVDSADRVCYFDLRPDNMPSFFLNLHLEDVQTSVNYESHGNPKQLRPCFYLPYRKNNTARMKLEAPTGYGGDEVRFFATATIDGCSVYIEGPNDTPKVTHINAQAISPTSGIDTWQQKKVKIQTKITDMDTRYSHIKKAQGTVVERPNYMVEKPTRVTGVTQRFAQLKGIPVGQVLSYQPFGSVIGVKDGTDWKFYMQKCGTFDYKQTPTGPGKTAYWVLEASEVWPNGAGVFRTIP